MKGFILDRAHEASTWRGLFKIAAAFGIYHFTPEQSDSLIYFLIAITGGAGLLPDSFRSIPKL